MRTDFDNAAFHSIEITAQPTTSMRGMEGPATPPHHPKSSKLRLRLAGAPPCGLLRLSRLQGCGYAFEEFPRTPGKGKSGAGNKVKDNPGTSHSPALGRESDEEEKHHEQS